ncbi:hypothetical protein OXYTRIMIC_225 [Oxytricha trifallax]|uniref:Uncharacterized protein n=1 Tax=Oxytricha trifallax TaxID=1172189 RepID=A0A073I0Q7_9SPIT|nr:hypothetical protein OXYTRIMIC_225 [Oxytricha trifallax]
MINRCVDPSTCNLDYQCIYCQVRQNGEDSKTQATQSKSKDVSQNLINQIGFSQVNRGSQQRVDSGQQQENLINQDQDNQNNNLFQSSQPLLENQNPSVQKNQQNQNQMLQIFNNSKQQNQNFNQIIRFKLDLNPSDKYSISKQQNILPYLYSLCYQNMFSNVVKYSQEFVKGEFYDTAVQSKTFQFNQNQLESLPVLKMKYPKKFYQFFHCLNLMMGSTFFISIEQAIQFALINIRKVGQIEKAFCRNKMFDKDNFIGGYRNQDNKNFKLKNFETQTFNQLMNNAINKGEILKFLNDKNVSPILVQVVDADQEDFLVIKRVNKLWYYFSQKGQIYQICNSINYQIPDLESQIEQIDQKQFIIQHFGSINAFQKVVKYREQDRQLDRTLFKVLHQIYETRNYLEVQEFWKELAFFSQQSLSKNQLNSTRFLLPELRNNYSNTYSNQNTQNQMKQAKKRTKKAIDKQIQETQISTSSTANVTPAKLGTGIMTRGQLKSLGNRGRGRGNRG